MKAREQFTAAVEKFGGPAAAAFALGCSRGTVDHIILGRRNPGLETAYAIECLFKIRMQDWCESLKVKTTRRLVGNG